MPKQEAPLHHLKDYLPEGSFEAVNYYLLHYKVTLPLHGNENLFWVIIETPFLVKIIASA